MGTGDMEKCNGSRSRSIWRQQHSSGPLAAWTAGSSDALGERSYRGSQPVGQALQACSPEPAPSAAPAPASVSRPLWTSPARPAA